MTPRIVGRKRAFARAALFVVAITAPGVASAADVPGRGPDPLIRAYAYNPAKSWLLSSTNLEPILVVLEPGEEVRAVLGVNVTLDPAEATAAAARGREMWFVAQKTGGGPAPRGDDAEARTVADGEGATRGNKRGDKQDKPGVDIRDEISFQPTGEMSPALVRVMTLSRDGAPRQHVFVLATRQSAAGWPAKPDPDAYAMVRVVYPKTYTREEIAAWRARRDAERQRRDDARLADRVVQDGYTIQRNDAYRAAPGVKSPDACAAFGPRPGMKDLTDDGATTAFFVPTGRPAPRLYADMLDGDKRALDAAAATVPGGVRYTLGSVYKRLYLSLEGQVCGVENDGFGAGPRQPGGGTGTVSPHVVRAPRVAPGTGVGGAGP